jgi:hypothetical protein
MPSSTPRRLPRSLPARRHRVGAGLAALTAGSALLAGAVPALAAGSVDVPTPPAGQLPASLIAQGTNGSAVAQVQRALHLPDSGRFGPRTRHAVQAFQRRHHLSVDGVVGPQTWDALFHLHAVPSSTSTPAGAGGGSATGTGGYTIPSSIVNCESHGNYSAVNPSSGAGGAYQILPSTWRAYGGTGLPQNASAAEQDRIASEIYARQGASAWSC